MGYSVGCRRKCYGGEHAAGLGRVVLKPVFSGGGGGLSSEEIFWGWEGYWSMLDFGGLGFKILISGKIKNFKKATHNDFQFIEYIYRR
jgi:hypothetical protein